MSIYADKGTVAHMVLETCLTNIYEIGFDDEARNYVGRAFTVTDEPHSRLSPSGSHRWMTCPGSIRMIGECESRPEGPRDLVFEEEDAVAVQVCLDYVAERVAEIGVPGEVEVLAERRVSPAAFLGTEDCDGTSDIALISVTEEYAEHIDYKHGAGVPVDEDGPQNKMYLLGTLAEFLGPAGPPFRRGRCTIVQPRCALVEPVVRWVEIEDMLAWVEDFSTEVRKAIAATEDPQAPLVASEKACRFCDARHKCSEHARFALSSVGMVDPDAPLPTTVEGMGACAEAFAARDVETLTGEQVAGLLEAEEIVIGMFKAVRAAALADMRDGRAPPEVVERFKLIRGRANRRWRDMPEGALVAAIKKLRIEDPDTGKRRSLKKGEIYVESLKSVAQMEKIFKAFGLGATAWKAFRALIDKPEGALNLVPRGHPGAEVARETAEELFGDTTLQPQMQLQEKET